MMLRRTFFVLAVIIIANININGQFNEYDPGYEWWTLDAEHVKVHYHPGAERTAHIVAKIADEIWEPITNLYQYEPEEVHFVIKDIDDYANGATYFFDNKIEIWASALDFSLRGTHNWLRNVISHEFTHMVQIQAGMKVGRSIPAVYLQFLNYEDKRRPDILYGYPNFIASYPIASINIPAWFAEGTAQYMREEFNYENWDTHRDMILRSYALEDEMLSWNEMGVFSKTSLGNETVYNSGYALTLYLSQKYGEDKLRKVTEKLGELGNFTIDQAFEEVLGKSGVEIYEEWSSFLKSDYEKRISEVKENEVEGGMIASTGFANFHPIYSEERNKIYYVSNKSADYFSLSGIYEYDVESKESKLLVSSVRSSIGVIPGENKIVYSKLSEKNPKWRKIHDIYVYDIDKEEETRLTNGLRANNPTVSNNGEKIAFIYQKDGTINLGTVDIDGDNFKRLTFFENGEQVYNPDFSNDDSSIVFGYSYANGRDIAKVATNATNFEFLIQTDKDERNPVYGEDGSLYYSSDETGIFNIYKYNFSDKSSERLTNVTGGAFQPDVNDNGKIIYAGYTASGYKIYEIDEEETKKVKPGKTYVWQQNPPLDQSKPIGDMENYNLSSLRNYNDYETPGYEKSEYSGFFTDLSVFPFIRYDNYNPSNSGLEKIKPGVYLASSDILNRYSLFAGGAINKNLERDLFLIFEYRDKVPGLYQLGLTPDLSLEVYSVSRKSNTDIIFDSLTSKYNTATDVSYNLFEFDLAAKHKIFNSMNNLEFRYIFSRYTATIESFLLPKTQELYPSTDDTYLIGSNLQLRYTHNMEIPTVDSDINPVGREIDLQYNYELNEFNKDSEYEVEEGMLKPLYDDFNFHRLELNYKEHVPIAEGHTLSSHLRAGSILGPPVPDFFDFYLGGLIGMKAYPFYAVSGNEIGWLNLTYRFPVWREIDARLGHLYFDKLFFSVYGDIGNAWTGSFPEYSEFKKGAGFEVRLKMNSFYLFPTSIFFNAAYSFDEFTREVYGDMIHYGKEWRLYGGILFDFNIY